MVWPPAKDVSYYSGGMDDIVQPLLFFTDRVLFPFSSFCVQQIVSKLREGGASNPTSGKKVIQVKGANQNITHSMNDDERSEFTAHINSVLAGDQHIGDRIPIPTHTMQVFDECRGTFQRTQQKHPETSFGLDFKAGQNSDSSPPFCRDIVL